jgi:hypothetical protein
LKPAGLSVVEDAEEAQEAARHALWSLHAQQAVRYVCIVGGWAEVAPYTYPNPSYGYGGDDDEFCLSDAPYGHPGPFDSEEIEGVFAEFPVGRVPSQDVDVLERVLLTRTVTRDARKALAFAVSAQVWTEATQTVVETFLGRKDSSSLADKPMHLGRLASAKVLLSPQWEEEHLAALAAGGALGPGAILLFNVHGSDRETDWVGDGVAAYTFPRVFSTGTVEDYNGAVLVTEACYGGKLDYDEPGIAETVFSRGGKAFVGCSMIAWGSSSTPSDADFIALGFLEAIQRGEEFGASMRAARQRVAEEMTPGATETSEKTILSFNFYGAPWDCLDVAASTSGTGSILERTRASRATAGRRPTLPKLEEIRERYMGRLGDRGRRFLLQREEARAKFETFPDAARIADELSRFGLAIDQCRMESVHRQGATSFQISGKSLRNEPRSMGVLVIVDEGGRHVATKTTKSRMVPERPAQAFENQTERPSKP